MKMPLNADIYKKIYYYSTDADKFFGTFFNTGCDDHC